MTRTEKEQLVSQLTDEFSSASAIIVCSYKGMTVGELENVRSTLKKSDIKVKVLKNKLASIALKNANKEGLELSDMNLAVWGEELVTVAKQIIEVEKDNEKLEIKAAHIEGEVTDKAAVEAYSKLPGREELLGMLLSTWTAPARNLVGVFSGVQREFVTIMNAIKEQKENA